MKRLLKIFLLLLTLLLALLLLYGCAQNSAEQSESVPESESQPESSTPEISFESEELLDYIAGVCTIYKRAASANETRKELIEGENGTLSTIIDVPATVYWITDSEGHPLIDHPFDKVDYANNMPDWGGHEDTPKEYLELPVVMGFYKGDFYRYYLVDGAFLLDAHDGYSCYDPRSDSAAYDYKYTVYYYVNAGCRYGLTDSKGNVIFEPIFAYFISIPFEDRFIGTINTIDRGDFTEGYSLLMDKDKNIFAAYTSISFHVFDDGSYIGLAGYSGYGYNWGKVLRDKNGKVLKVGERFIDKDGNEISPCFNGVTGFWDITSPSDIITAVDENGNTIEIKASDYICKP